MKIVGIDMTQSAKPCSLVVLNDRPEIIDTHKTRDDEEIVKYCDGADVVAIDSPLFLPAGLCCLKKDCDCQPISEKKGRESEQELSKRHIPSYYTTKKTFIKKMIERSMEIAKKISMNGTKVIEIYPHASSFTLFGKLPKKTTPNGFCALKEHFRKLVYGTEQIQNHDQADALLGAYTGWLWLNGKSEGIGNQDEGFIWIPKGPANKPLGGQQ
jgi:uncharacterized protein